MRRQPSRCLGDDCCKEEDAEENNALEDGGNPPSIARGVVYKAVIDPVHEENTKVQSRKLCADVDTAAGFRTELGLHDGYR